MARLWCWLAGLSWLVLALACLASAEKSSSAAAVTPDLPAAAPPIPRSFTWVGDKDGLVSHFLQLKIYALLASTYQRVLYVSPIFSIHYGNRPTHLCDVFDLRAVPFVRCIDAVAESCSLQMTPAVLASPAQRVCYKGPLPNILAAANRKESVLRAVNLTNIQLRLNDKYAPVLMAVKQALGVGGGAAGEGQGEGGRRALRAGVTSAKEAKTASAQALPRASAQYTVAHWRRGDQLRTRCKAQRDLSVNCGSAADLIAAIRRLSNDSIVYVATNEAATSDEYAALLQAGFRLFSSVKVRQTLVLILAFRSKAEFTGIINNKIIKKN